MSKIEKLNIECNIKKMHEVYKQKISISLEIALQKNLS